MRAFSLQMSRVVHENLSIVLGFAWSRAPLRQLVADRFQGEWKYLNKALFEYAAVRAEKACLELALFLRMLDEEEDLSEDLPPTDEAACCGKLIKRSGADQKLHFREFANKMIHSSRLEWKCEPDAQPQLIVHSRDEEKWIRAEVDLVALASICGRLAS